MTRWDIALCCLFAYAAAAPDLSPTQQRQHGRTLRWCDEWSGPMGGPSHCTCDVGRTKQRHKDWLQLPLDLRELWGWACESRLNPSKNCVVDRQCSSCSRRLRWSPVCGDDGETYANSCRARCRCVEYTPGACRTNIPPDDNLPLPPSPLPESDHVNSMALLKISAHVTTTHADGNVTYSFQPALDEELKKAQRKPVLRRVSLLKEQKLTVEVVPAAEKMLVQAPTAPAPKHVKVATVPVQSGTSNEPDTPEQLRSQLHSDGVGDDVPTHLQEWHSDEEEFDDQDDIPAHLQEWHSDEDEFDDQDDIPAHLQEWHSNEDESTDESDGSHHHVVKSRTAPREQYADEDRDLEAVREQLHGKAKHNYAVSDWDGDGEVESSSSKYTIRTESAHDAFKDDL